MNSNFCLYSTLVFLANVASVSTPHNCTTYNPHQINGTQALNTTICPKGCTCHYCPDKLGIYMVHYVKCKRANLERIPSENIPVDVGVLRLGQNHITTIASNDTSNFHGMVSLYLNDNQLQYNNIDDHSFDNLTKLTILNLNYNRALSHLARAWFQKLVGLEILYIRYSSVKTLQRGIFKNCVNLNKVYLSGNQIAKIPKDTFRELRFLNIVDLSHNNINHLNDDMFLGSRKISGFFAENNQLTTIGQQVGIQNLTKLSLLGFGYNPLICDCNLVWFCHWIKQTNATLVDPDQLTCENKNGTTLFGLDTDHMQCYGVTTIVIIAACCSVTFVAVVCTVIYVFRWDFRYWNQRRLLRKQYERLQNEGPPPIDGVQIRYDAFVSYNSKDRDWVLKSALPILEGPEFNFRLCVDFRDFLVGGVIADNISDAIKYSRKMLIVVTKNFAKSEWCYFEMEMARTRMFDDHEDILVVVILEHVASRNMPTLLQKILRKKTYIEWTENSDGQKVFWTRLAAALNTPNAHHDRLLN
ncbi:toll-like receptor 2 [Anneissia japonica]|uniref:toll-like receptor 2 n=1 Tax=Anneissia japonica TaxID=1529436 RepID=UPI001425BB84|nr:toll-like receptor 2 [Anneissia japonica]